ncbi:MAG: spore coat protein U domain-containing protein [Nitrospirae bacterium]|nr:spore coat protein U domain-containing protein [Nitrospirota bacterium]
MKLKLPIILLVLMGLHVPDTVIAACTVSTTPVTFGSYNVFSTGPLDATGTVTVNCNEAPPPTVTISIGQSTNSGGFDPRAMKLAAGSELLSYNLYTDSNRTYIWGDGSGNTSTVRKKVFKSTPMATTVYGRVPPIQNVSAGSYNEVLTVTIVW